MDLLSVLEIAEETAIKVTVRMAIESAKGIAKLIGKSASPATVPAIPSPGIPREAPPRSSQNEDVEMAILGFMLGRFNSLGASILVDLKHNTDESTFARVAAAIKQCFEQVSLRQAPEQDLTWAQDLYHITEEHADIWPILVYLLDLHAFVCTLPHAGLHAEALQRIKQTLDRLPPIIEEFFESV